MEQDNLLLEKSFAFSLRIIRLRKYLLYDAPQKEMDISRQLFARQLLLAQTLKKRKERNHR